MKKAVCVFLVIFIALFSFCGCSKETKLKVDEISNSLSEICFKNSDYFEVSKADIENRFNFDGNILDQYCVRFCGNEENYICVAVMTLKDKGDKPMVIESINAAAKVDAASFGVLDNSQYKKIQKRIFCECEGIIIYVVADDYERIQEYLDEIGANPIR